MKGPLNTFTVCLAYQMVSKSIYGHQALCHPNLDGGRCEGGGFQKTGKGAPLHMLHQKSHKLQKVMQMCFYFLKESLPKVASQGNSLIPCTWGVREGTWGPILWTPEEGATFSIVFNGGGKT